MSGTSAVTQVRLQGLGILILVFVSGLLAGAAIARWRTPEHVPTSAAETQVVPTQDVIASMKMAGTGVPVVYEALGLTEAQRDQIRAIMDANRPRTDSLLRTTWPLLRALLDTVQRQVEQVLTPQQRRQLQAIRRGAPPANLNRTPNGRIK
jgi:hypothetical protein